jgi:hydroxyacylglutathione hydrolase
MYLQQFFIEGLGHGSYLVGDEGAGVAAVIDPRRDVDVYLDAAAAAGLAIRHVLETHTHNDYVSGARELAAATGASLWASRAGGGAGLRFAHRPLWDGDEVRLGAITLRAWETPGHTSEHLTFLAFERGRKEPLAAFTGGSLMVGGAGRTDLSGEDQARALAHRQYKSVRRLLGLPDHVQVYPTHGAGSFCGGGSGPRWSTIGQERRANALAGLAAAGDADGFAEQLLNDLPIIPAYWRRTRPLNQHGPDPLAALGAVPGLPGLLPARPLTPNEVHDLTEREAAYVVDARGAAAFGGAHLGGSFGIGLGTTFGVWVGTVVPNDRPLVLVLPGGDDPLPGAVIPVWDAAVRQLLRAGYERIAGYLEGGVRTWAAAGLPFESLPQLSAREAWARLQRGEREFLDVRQPREWAAGHAPGAVFLPGAQVPTRARELHLDQPWAVACSTGFRSTVVASVLLRAGATDVANVLGGMAAWSAAGLPTEVGREPGAHAAVARAEAA